MANSKISALTAAATPLAGTEVVPLVQSGVTKKVAVSDLTAGRAVSVASLTATGNVNFSGTGNRITGDFSNGTIVNRVLFQTSTTNGSTSVDLIPNGTSAVSSFRMYNSSSDPDNASFGQFVITSAEVRTASNRTGTGTYLPYTIYTNGVEQFRVTTAGNIEARTGNFVQYVAGKGIDFSANSAAAGMTSQLLNWYEEGTWTPTDGSGAGLTFATATGKYARIGRQVTITFVVVYPTTANTNTATISGLPFAASGNYVGACINNKVSAQAYIPNGTSAINLYTLNSLDDWKNSAVSGGTIIGTVTYMV